MSRPRWSSTATTWMSLWVSTPPVTRAIVVIATFLLRSGWGGTHQPGGRTGQSLGLLHRRLFGHGRPTDACTERASLTRPTDHFKDSNSVRPFSGSDRVSGALSST